MLYSIWHSAENKDPKHKANATQEFLKVKKSDVLQSPT